MGHPVPLPIPWTMVREWCEFHNYPGEYVPLLDSLLREMDAEWMAWRLTQLPKP